MPSHKVDRIASDISKYISEIISLESRDEILKSVTITSCRLSKDLGYCKVFFTSMLDDVDPKTLEKELNEASSFIRGRLSEKIDIRHTPTLNFVYDESIEYGKRIEDIIKNINSDKNE